MNPWAIFVGAATLACAIHHGAGLAIAADERPRNVPADAAYFNGRWFRIFEEKVSWRVAMRRCESLGGRLAVAPDQGTWVFVSRMIGNSIVWLGASDAETEGRWVWIDGTPMTFAAWLPGQPNNKENEDYLHTWKGGWNDNEANGRMREGGRNGVIGFVCEWGKK